MSTKRDFLTALGKKITALEKSLSTVALQCTTAEQEQRTRLVKRTDRLDALVTELLPDLDPKTIMALEKKLPKVITVKHIEGFRTEFLHQQEISVAEAMEKGAANAVRHCINTKGLQQLIDDGYGTPAYCTNFWQRKFYADWKRADEIIERFQKETWDQVVVHYNELTAELRAAQNALASARAHERPLHTTPAMDALILGKVRVQLKAALDALDPKPDWMRFIKYLDKQIGKHARSLMVLQKTRDGVQGSLNMALALRTKAVHSPVREVPRHYVTRVSRDSDTDILMPLLLYTMMSDHFSTPHDSASTTDRMTGHGGEFGGAGASQSYTETSSSGRGGSPS
jgi:hypothetical protein